MLHNNLAKNNIFTKAVPNPLLLVNVLTNTANITPMKKLILLFFALLTVGTVIKAQKTVVVCGEIDRAVINQTVWINYFSTPSSCNVTDSTHTDSTGKFSYTFTVGSGCAYRNVVIGMLGCKSIYDSLFQFKNYKPSGSGPDTIKANFSYCDTCTLKASFTDSINGLKVDFTNTSPNSNNKFKWYFGDTSNSTSTLASPTFTYPSAGSYTVCFVVEDTLGVCKDSICKTIFVGCNNFQASFIDTLRGYCLGVYSTSSTQANQFSWSFGATTPNANFKFNNAATYNLCLIARDSTNGCADTACKTINIGTTCDCFEASFNSSIPRDTGFFFNTSTNSNFNSNIYTWRFGDGGTSTQKNPQHIYNSSGSYNVTLIAKDTVRNCEDSTTITIGISTCNNFNANFSDTVRGDTLKMGSYGTSVNANKFTWIFGDGQTSVAKGRAWQFGSAVTHIYSASGTYNVCLVAEDTIKNCIDTTCKQITIGSSNPCLGFDAAFNDSIRSDTVMLTNTSSSSANKLLWTFGNGQSSTAQNPTVVYGSSGTYTLCLLARDTINNCFDSICKQITITIPNICSGFTASFTDSIRSDTASFTFTGSTAANKFSWNFGNGQTSNAQNPTHIYAKDSLYSVCLVAEDTINNCTANICRNITINTSTNCVGFDANFSFTDSCATINFTNLSSSSANTFNWYFGNGSTSTIKSPSHTYNIPVGTYPVFMVARDTINNCIDSAIKSVPFKNNLSGTVFRNNNQKADSGMVWLIEMTIDTSTNDTILTAIDSAIFFQPDASYKFSNVTSGDYLVKAALLPGAAFYGNRLPTYYDKETRWDKATFINVNGPCVTTDIVLRSGNNPGGAGFIGGLVKQGANKTGDPLQKITVLLFNADGNPFGFTETDINGNYEFANIAYGDYKVIVDVLGKPSDEYNVTVNAAKPKDYKGNFEVNKKDVKLIPFIPGSVITLSKHKLNIYPNPTQGNSTAVFDAAKNGTATVIISDLTGKTIVSQNIETIAGENSVELEINNLVNGLYIVTIKTENAAYIGRLGITK